MLFMDCKLTRILIMGMITRVRGRLRSDSMSKLDPRVKDEKIAKTGNKKHVIDHFTL